MFSFPVPEGCPGHTRAVPRGQRPQGTGNENMVHPKSFLCTYSVINLQGIIDEHENVDI